MNHPDTAVISDDILRSVDGKITAVRTQSLDFSFNELADMYAQGELIIDPDFQRLFRWSEGAQSRFVESLLLELPVPPIFLIEREDRLYELIDGLQRLSSYLHFRGILSVNGKTLPPLTLSECDIVTELNGRVAGELPRALDIKLKRSYIRAEILRKESDPRLRYYMFKRLNTGGEILSSQEVRNATIRLLSNDFNQFIMALSETADFQFTTKETVAEGAKQRRFDQELVLRFFAFKNDFNTYKHDVADFLTEYMEAVSDESRTDRPFDYDVERATFEKTFTILRRAAECVDRLGPRVFGSVLPKTAEPRGQFSVYHFEGLTLGIQSVLDRIDPDNGSQMLAIGQLIMTGKADPDFLKHTGAGKNDPNPLRARVEFFRERFEALLG